MLFRVYEVQDVRRTEKFEYLVEANDATEAREHVQNGTGKGPDGGQVEVTPLGPIGESEFGESGYAVRADGPLPQNDDPWHDALEEMNGAYALSPAEQREYDERNRPMREDGDEEDADEEEG